MIVIFFIEIKIDLDSQYNFKELVFVFQVLMKLPHNRIELFRHNSKSG